MEDKITNTDEESSIMFLNNINNLSSDEQLALKIIHKFNIDRDTIESMPAFYDHLKPILCKDELDQFK